MQSSFLRAFARVGAFAILACCAPAHAAAPVFTVIHSFNGDDGYVPYSALVQGSDGNFYGTTNNGGPNVCGGQHCGTVFKVTPGGAFTMLHAFNGADGRTPLAGLVQGKDGNFYGTTAFGGANDTGAIFKITANGVFTLLHSFAPDVSFQNEDGEDPVSGLVVGADGNLYGTTEIGAYGGGTIFRITPSGTLTTLHRFLFEEGELPAGGVIFGADGKLYGACVFYGPNGGGTIFRFDPVTTQLSILYAFSGGNDGGSPVGGVIQGTDGNLYGTTRDGGATNQGTVFKLAGGVLTTLHTFSGPPDGIGPDASLLQANDGALYGSTMFGGAGGGTLFRVTTGGQYSVMHTFQGGADDGAYPAFGALIQSRTDGALYATAQYGGAFSQGVVYKITIPNVAPQWISPPTPLDNAVFNLTATRPFSIALRAGDVDALDTVHIAATSKPSAAVVTSFDGNPGNATFQWTPAQAGDFVAIFQAADVGAPLPASPLRTIRLHVVKRATSIVAQPAIVEVATASVHLHAIADLSASDPVAPLAGKLVRFTTTDGKLICASTTDNTGRASCTGVPALIATVASRGYIATFAGDSAYQGSSQYGYLIH